MDYGWDECVAAELLPSLDCYGRRGVAIGIFPISTIEPLEPRNSTSMMAMISSDAMGKIKELMAIDFHAKYIPQFDIHGNWIGGGTAAELAACDIAGP